MSADGDAAQRPLCCIVRQADPAVSEEQSHGRPALQAVIDSFGDGVFRGQLGALLGEPGFEIFNKGTRALLSFGKARQSGQPIDLTLDGEQLVDTPNGLDGDRRFLQRGEFVKLSPGVAPAGGLDNGRWLARSIVKLAIARISVGLHDAGPA